MHWRLLGVLVAASQATGGPPLDVSSLAVGRAALLAELDPSHLEGEPRQLSWSPNADELYVQVDRGTTATIRH